MSMTLDYNSLLSALGLSSVCLLLTLSGTWLGRRETSFMLSWVIGLGVCVGGIISYSVFIAAPSSAVGALAMVLMQWGSCILYGAAEQFRMNRFPLKRVVIVSTLASLAITIAFIVNYWGIGFSLLNLGVAVAFLATAHQYWLARDESRGIITGIALLYGIVAASFMACTMAIIHHGTWVMTVPPSGLAEDINVASCIAGMTGIGGLSLTAHQARLTALHRLEAMTDALTGLYNRRALFETYKQRRFRENMAILVFDIDRFKSINDQYGHAAGDQVIQAVARELKAAVGVNSVARLGGEEFAAVVENATPGLAEWIGERIRRQLQDCNIVMDAHNLRVTTSIGICYGTAAGMSFEEILKHADDALYDAKRMGRNRIEVACIAAPTITAVNRA
jgi:diguanylate cyclase (GGDEF)-like protein